MKQTKTPLILQMADNECGITVLRIMLAYYGCHVSTEDLRTKANVSRDGLSSTQITQIAKSYHLDANITRMTIDNLRQLQKPVILFWNKQHFVILECIKNNIAYVNDPQSGRKKIDLPTFKRLFSDVVILLHPSQQFKKQAPNRSHPFKSFAKENRAAFFFLTLLAILLTIPSVITPLFSKVFIDHVLIRHSIAQVTDFFLLMLLVLIAQCMLIYTQRVVLRVLEAKIAVTYGITIINTLMQLPIEFFAHRKAGDLSHRIQANERIAETLAGPYYSAFVSFLQIITYLSIMCCYNLLLSTIFFTLTLCQLGLHAVLKNHQYQLIARQKQHLSNLISSTLNTIAMIMHIKATGNELYFFGAWQKQLTRYLNTYHRFSFFNALLTGSTYLFNIVTQTFILIIGTYLITKHKITMGEFIALNALLFAFADPLQQLMSLSGHIQQIKVDHQRVEDILQYQPPRPLRDENLHAQSFTLTPTQSFKGKIEIIDLCFGYNQIAAPLLDNINMTIEANTRVAIIGMTGSGKSTLAHLIAGIYKPWSGQILIDGIPVTALTPEERACMIAYVSQDQFFFKGSIKENLTMWNNCYTEQLLLQTLSDTCCHEFISQLDKKLDYQLTDGATNLSGGQRQRLEITRALLMKPRILLLDEASSALDPLLEHQIDKNIRAYGLTFISIAHRFNTIQDVDYLYIMDCGKIVDAGTPLSLKKQQSAYFHALLRESD